MNGLEVKYGDKLTFLREDVSTSEGQQAFRVAALTGHPGFLILKPDGTELWRAVGQQQEQTLVVAIERSLTSSN